MGRETEKLRWRRAVMVNTDRAAFSPGSDFDSGCLSLNLRKAGVWPDLGRRGRRGGKEAIKGSH